MSVGERCQWIEQNHAALSVVQQCKLLDVPRSTYYYRTATTSELNLALMHRIDELYTEHPSFGSRTMTAMLMREGEKVNRKRIQ